MGNKLHANHPTSTSEYGRLRTKDGHYIGSKWIRRNEDWSRINYTVMVKIEVDIYANYPKRPSIFEIQDFYAIVEYYLTYEFEGFKVMLAYIQWTEPVHEDNVGVKTFRRMGAYEFIDASAIDHCVAFIEIDKLFYIVDKEVDSDE